MHAVLPALAEREGTPRVALQAAKHLSMCKGCAERLLRLRQLNGLLDDLPEEDIPTSFTRRVLRALPRKLGAGSGLVVLAALVGRGPGHSLASLGLTIVEMARAPFEAAASAIAAFLFAAIDLASTARTALQDTSVYLQAPRISAAGFIPTTRVLPLVLLAAVGLLASVLAFRRSASAMTRENR